ncbi:hypothetical protein [Sorangium sp. So ce124]|uniref:hypothetical protein n=1 Tax=Sorangium sp. So ce124 TaxID=3133280 RepID=UPI003F629888
MNTTFHRVSALVLSFSTVAVLALSGCTVADEVEAAESNDLAVDTGNGSVSGAHYTLNIIGVPRGKSANMTGGDGRRIFVGLGSDGAVSSTRIDLTEGDFAVLDANGTDGRASFQLPNPDPDCDGTTSYSVYVRALAKPGGHADMQSCYEDETGTWCAVDFAGGVAPITITRTKGKQTFVNVSKDLLYIDYCAEWDATTGECLDVNQVPLFGDDNLAYFWQYDNQGLKLAQLRFYEIATDTNWEPVCPQ